MRKSIVEWIFLRMHFLQLFSQDIWNNETFARVAKEECKKLSNEHEMDNLIISASQSETTDSSEIVTKKGKTWNGSSSLNKP